MAATDDHWIMVRVECCCSGLWNKPGDVVWSDELPISRALQQRIEAWQRRYDEEESRHDGPPPWECYGGPIAELNAEGRSIGYALKAELPDQWTVVVEDLDGWRRASAGEPPDRWLLTLAAS